ncbi:MAG: DUF4157 domain-containing protein, partial [Anaerolineales bacterium]|nr:DUF4157 domain-containing protein [Anaerolineales bacterium]
MDHNSKSSAHADLEGRRFAPPSNQAGWRDERKTARGSATSTAGNQAVQRLLQERAILPKLEIGSPNDPQEREAEDAAECLANGIPCNNCIGPSFHRFPASPLSPKNNPGATAGPASAAEDFVPRSGGRPLEPAVRAEMEASFGEDFSAVRVHTGGEAAASAKSIRALAYTAGSDVVFDSGRYAP